MPYHDMIPDNKQYWPLAIGVVAFFCAMLLMIDFIDQRNQPLAFDPCEGYSHVERHGDTIVCHNGELEPTTKPILTKGKKK